MKTFGREPGNLFGALLLALVVFVLARNSGWPPSADAATGQGAGANSAVTHGSKIDAQKAALRAGLSSSETLTHSAIIATTPLELLRAGDGTVRCNIPVCGHFSASGATITVTPFYYYLEGGTYYPLGPGDPLTLTAGAGRDANSKYMSLRKLIDGGGATHIFFMVTTSVSSGTCDLFVGSYS